MKKFLIIIFLLITVKSFSQDVIKVMHYNLLYYGIDVYDCNQTNNGINDKTNYLKTIINHVQPDIFTVNEIDVNNSDQTYLLNNVFILNGLPNYSKGEVSGSFSGNQVFYNNSKLTLYDQDYVSAWPSQFDIYKFRYNSPDEEQAQLWCIVAHLKAGSSAEDEEDRADATLDLMSSINSVYGSGNYLLSGDLNLYSSSEEAYQNLLNYSNSDINFNDPINSPGDWNNNSSFSNIHTQSTHVEGDCPSGGGMDDRFDFILISNKIKNNSDKISYISGTYKAIGQDGNHFNDNLTDGTNNSVPSDVLNALYNNSDHLPVYLEISVNQTPASVAEFHSEKLNIKIQNPVKDFLNFTIYINDILNFSDFGLEIFNSLGQEVYAENIQKINNKIEYKINVENLNSGLYILKITDRNNNSYQAKFIKN